MDCVGIGRFQTTLISTSVKLWVNLARGLISSTQSCLQVPSTARTKRNLRPPSPSRPQPGFIVPPKDSRSALTVSTTPEEITPGPLAHRTASPRPPTTTNGKTKTTSENTKKASQNQTKPTQNGKVSSTFYCVIHQSM
ncbi:hypothetical protein DFH28DRAFT_935429 [Melampsora americana]|nr:hypothetical protein DFH28DRAFT_935429 [Melampsora americana]